jgi:hypothetical protein
VSVTGFTGATGWLKGASAQTAKGNAKRTAASAREKVVETILAPYTRTSNCPRQNPK